MRMLALKRLMSAQSERRRRRRSQIRARAHDGCVSSLGKRKKKVCQYDDISPGGKRLRYSVVNLPEDILCHIHSFMPLRDAARTACVSRSFRQSWICHPNLTFNKHMLGLNSTARGADFMRTIDHVLKKHSGINIKTLTLELYDFDDVAKACLRRLDNWLQIALRPGIEEITLNLTRATYKFPCWLLSDRIRNSIRHLQLSSCVFRPTAKLGPFRSLAMLRLLSVRITGHKLGYLLSNTVALTLLDLRSCPDLDCLKIPSLLQRLSCLMVSNCPRLREIESKAPNLLVFRFMSGCQIKKLSLGGSLKLKQLYTSSPDVVNYGLLSSVPNLESLTLSSRRKVGTTLVLPIKFLYLKHLSISLTGWEVGPDYDYFSLVSLLDSCPSLDTFALNASQQFVSHRSIFRDPSDLRQMPEYQHDNLKSVKITGFCSVKSLVELTCHIVDNTALLEILTLDITTGHDSCHASGICVPILKGMLMEAPRALLAIRTYIQGKIRSTVKLNVLEPCSRCHTLGH